MICQFAGLLRAKKNSLRDLPGLSLLLILGLTGWMAACTTATANPPSAQPQPYTFYLDTWTEDVREHRLVPLDPETLEDQPGGKTLELGIVSADGSTGVDVSYSTGRASRNPEDIWIVVYDLQGGGERIRFHPPARGFVSGLNEDGTRLLLQPDPYPSSRYPPIAEWYVVDTTSGELLAQIKDADNSCFRQRAHFDPAGQRIYCAVDPASSGADEPGPLRLVAYDAEGGERAGELELPTVIIGGSERELNGQPVGEFFEPAVKLSPDGQRLVIVHADTDRITLIDAQNLTIEKSFSLDRRVSLWDWLVPAVAHAKGVMEGTIHQANFSSDGQYLYVFSQEIRARPDETPAERGLWLVDLEQGNTVAKALPQYQIQWVRAAPDGTVYVFGTTDEDLGADEIRSTSPSRLWHLEGHTLEIMAERAFTGYRHGHLVNGATATAHTDLDCPVTQPPEAPFIPPDPWPAQPPAMGQFWFGESGLWTALPVSGSWPQLALGEKFWWWSEQFDVAKDATPDLMVTARRLDGDAPTFQLLEATNGYHESFNWAMLSGVKLGSPGCWEFTAQYREHQLSFVLWVPSE